MLALRSVRVSAGVLRSFAATAASTTTLTKATVRVPASFTRGFAAPPFRRPSGGGGAPQQRPSNPPPRKGAPERISRPTANGAIRHDPIRVIDKAGNHVGVVRLAEGLALAKAAGSDLVVITATAEPPVCRIMSLREHIGDLTQAAVDRRRAQRRAEPKEVRLTARTDAHDLGVKATKVVDFLKDGRSVSVTVTLMPQQLIREEPARRDVLGKVVKAVAAAGAGLCDAASIRSVGVSLSAHFSPCASAKTAAEGAAKALAVLATPIRPGAASAAATADAASAGGGGPAAPAAALLVDDSLDLPPEVQLAAQAAPVTVPIDRLLPSDAALDRMRRRFSRAAPAATPGGSDAEGSGGSDFDDEGGVRGGGGGRSSSDDGFPTPKVVAKRPSRGGGGGSKPPKRKGGPRR